MPLPRPIHLECHHPSAIATAGVEGTPHLPLAELGGSVGGMLCVQGVGGCLECFEGGALGCEVCGLGRKGGDGLASTSTCE